MQTPNPLRILSLALLAIGAPATLAVAAPPRKAAPPPPPVDFSRDIRPVISAKCYACHGPDDETRAVGLRLDLRTEAVKTRNGRAAIVPGNPAASRAYVRITAKEPAQRMPPP